MSDVPKVSGENMSKLRDKMVELGTNSFNNGFKALTERVTPEVQKQRFDICQNCEYFYKVTTTCKKCGCFMKLKTWMPAQKCPINKWLESEPNNE